ncbi:hypothetical protein FCK19_22800, partial [Salmonella enterica]|nr:hypothetical protein [Salmonella enterica]
MAEVYHRAGNQMMNLMPGEAITWWHQDGNATVARAVLRETAAFPGEDMSQAVVSAFWTRFASLREMAGFMACLGRSGRILCQRGAKGDPYSIPVLHLVLSGFIREHG